MRGDGLAIGAIGVVLPPRADASEAVRQRLARERDIADQRLVGVTVSDESAAELGRRAAALAWSRYAGRQRDTRVAHLLAGNDLPGTPLWSAPAWIAQEVIGPSRTSHVEFTSTVCGSGVHVLAAAARMLRCEPDLDSVLCTVSDVVDPRLVDRWGFDSGVTLGDGAGAVVLSRSARERRLLCVLERADVSLEAGQRGGRPPRPGDARPTEPVRTRDLLRDVLASSGTTVAEIVRRHRELLVTTVEDALREAGVAHDEVSLWALPFVGHSAAQEGYLRALGIDESRTVWRVGLGTGHLGGADTLVALDEIERHALLGDGEVVVLIGVGSGQTCSVAVVRW